MKVTNMVSRNGNAVPNQFIVYTSNGGEHFQSYNSVIAVKFQGKITLDEYYWNYSKTTTKYLCIFLDVTPDELRKNIKNGLYTLVNLN